MENLIKKQDKIYVAGHRGMAGGAIVRALKKNGYENIICFERNQLDLEDINQVENMIQKESPNIVILAAAKVGGIMANFNFPAEFILNNLKIQTNLIESAWRNNVKRFIFLGSSCVYPKLAKQPIKENYLLDGFLEDTNEYYALAKIAGIKLCQALSREYGFDAICLMPTNLYGPGDNYDVENSHVLPALIRKFYEATKFNHEDVVCWGDGSPLREFLHCDDLGDAVVFVLEKVNKKIISNINVNGDDSIHINLGTSKEISIKELAKYISKEFRFKGKIRWDLEKPNGTPQKKLDISLLSNLGWIPKIKFTDGIRMTISDYKNLVKNKIHSSS